MIFRRSSTTSSRNQNRQNPSSAPRQNQGRREPGLESPAYGKTAPTAVTPPSNPALQAGNGMSAPAPMSPLAMAQARRNPNGPAPAGNYSRQEQLRKLTVGRDICLNGEITTCDHLVVEGTVTATVKGGQILEIMETGAFSGHVDIEQADIAGRFEGNLTVRSKLVLRPTAVVTGTIRYGSLQVDNGARLDGQISPLAASTQQQGPDNSAYYGDQGTSVSGTAPLSSQGAESYGSSGQNSASGNGQNPYLSSVLDQPGFLKVS